MKAFTLLTRTVLWLFLVIGLAACSPETYPAITETPTATYTPGKVIWHDLLTRKPDVAKRFYGYVFGWEFEEINTGSPSYTLIRHDGRPIGGIFGAPDKAPGSGSEWLSSVSTTNVQAAIQNVADKGGKPLGDITPLTGRGMQAWVTDPSGAIIGLLHSDTGDPTYDRIPMEEWCWLELWSNDPEASADYYRELGYEIEKTTDDDRPYWLLKYEGKRYGGITQNPVPDLRPTWVPYIRVEDPMQKANKVKSGGGKVLLQPSAEVRQGSVAVCIDPNGAPFVLQKFSYND